MNMDSEPIPSYEKFGFELLVRASGEGLTKQWENDFARIFWQCLEVSNGGFEQWIGNTGKKGVCETLEALQRYALTIAHRITQEIFEIGNLKALEENTPIHEHLEERLEGWCVKFRRLDEAYWEQIDVIHEALKRVYHTRIVGMQMNTPAA